jgi:hypothetical protein
MQTACVHGWRLRPADLSDIDGLQALEANPLVYRRIDKIWRSVATLL